MRIYRKRGAPEAGFERPEGMPEPLYRLLAARGVSSVEEARAFLKPDADMLRDPALLPGAPEAARVLRDAVAAGERICVYGDYDVDGVSATSIMHLALTRLGARTETYLPSRHEEGYGLNERAVREIAGRCRILMTVDCGVTSVELVALAASLGLLVIVTDHHKPGPELPDCLVVNPLVGDYPEKGLCGAGVAFKIAEALLGRAEAMDYIDLAALATVADVVPLKGENRAIVKLGLDAMNVRPRLGISELRVASGLSEKPFTSGMLGFQIGPRLNASGRVGSARRAYKLLTTEDGDEARALANELNAENALRKKYEEEIIATALKKLEGFDFIAHRAIVLAGEGWNSGVIGLAAARLVERFHFPTILISLDGETGVGSCRSIPGIDIHKALTAAREHMVKFGGHAQAAGLTVERGKIPALADALDVYLRESADPALYIPVSEYDVDARFEELGTLFVALTELFAPTGMGNPAPVLRTKASVAEVRRVGRDGAHLSLKLNDGTNMLRAIAFREGERADALTGEADVLYAPFINEFGGKRSVELEVKAIMPAGNTEIIARARTSADALLAAFLTEMIYNRAYSAKSARNMSRAQLDEALARSPQGTLVVAADAQSAALFETLDVAVGKYPDDPRAFNCVCLLPTGTVPKGFFRIVYAGMHAPEGGWTLEGPRTAWVEELPGIDELRRAYVAVRRLLSRPSANQSLDGWARSLSDECALGVPCAMASILVLIDMGLVERGDGWRLAPGVFRKTDPMDSAAFRRLYDLKEGGVARESS